MGVSKNLFLGAGSALGFAFLQLKMMFAEVGNVPAPKNQFPGAGHPSSAPENKFVGAGHPLSAPTNSIFMGGWGMNRSTKFILRGGSTGTRSSAVGLLDFTLQSSDISRRPVILRCSRASARAWLS